MLIAVLKSEVGKQMTTSHCVVFYVMGSKNDMITVPILLI